MAEFKSLIPFYYEIAHERFFVNPHKPYFDMGFRGLRMMPNLYSEISGEPIFSCEPWNFAHILNKGSYPKLKFSKINVVIMTKEEHTLFDDHTDKAKQDPRFDWVFLLRDYLKGKSHGKSDTKFIRA